MSKSEKKSGDTFVDNTTIRENVVVDDCRHVVNSMLSGKSPFEERILTKFAGDEVEKLCRNSDLISEDAEGRITRFDRKELFKGHILGKGGYSTVSEITGVKFLNLDSGEGDTKNFGKVLLTSMSRRYSFKCPLSPDSQDKTKVSSAPSDKIDDMNCDQILDWEEDDMTNQVHDRKLIAKHCMRGGKARYAFKMLHSSYHSNPKQHFNGIIDLAVEARFLAFVRHPHIVRMRAMSLGDPYKSGFFIILDRLYDTLAVRTRTWAAEKKRNKKLIRKFRGGTEANNLLWNSRLIVMYDIASALSYLHSMSVIYRDLKPENLGFDIKGRIKLFDFGLAAELRPENMLDDGTYKIPKGGTLRYMSPEVAKKQPCNCSADVYSLGVLLWFVLALETPFKGFTVEKHWKLVVQENYRPKIPSSWSSEIKSLIENSWSVNIQKRPTSQKMCEILSGVIGKFLYPTKNRNELGNYSVSSTCSSRT